MERAAALVAAAQHGVILSGAGISTPSGIPDFRSPASGLWRRSEPEAVASLDSFCRNPQAFYTWLRPLLLKIAQASPNPAHQAVARLESQGRVQAVITQNIDGLHQQAGSRRVLELHGRLRQATCLHCGRHTPTEGLIDAFLATGSVPACPHCRGLLKPDVVLYGEQLPADVLQEAEAQAQACDLMLVAGSSLSVVPASLLPRWATSHGARLIIVNRTPTGLDARADVVLRDDLALVLPAIAQACSSGAASHSGGPRASP